MASSNENVSMALFCDFENVALGVRDAKYDKFDIKLVLERLLLKGSIVVKKAYCDWDRYKSFKGAMHEANFELIEIPHVRQSGKNSADIRLVVDALDLCYTKSHVNTFVIISGDSDFSPLVSKLRENAKQVIGVGVQQSTSDLLIANCDEFFFYDDLVRESQRTVARRESSRPQQSAQQAAKRAADEEKAPPKEDLEKRRSKAVEIAVQTFDALASERGDSGKIWASVLKNAIKRRKPDFNETYYGFRAFGNLLEEAQARGLLEFGRDEKSGAYVYRSTAVNVAGEAVSEPIGETAPESAETGAAEAVAAERTAEPSHEAQAAASESGGKHKSRRKDRNNRKAARGQQESAHGKRGHHETAEEESAAAAPVPAEHAEPTEPIPRQEPREHVPLPHEIISEPIAEESEARAATAQADTATEQLVFRDESDQTTDSDQPAQRQSAKKRATRKPASKKVKKSAPPPIGEVPETVAPAEAPAPAVNPEEAPASARKVTRKTASRSRRPRKAASTDNAE